MVSYSSFIPDRFVMELPGTIRVNGSDNSRHLSPNCLLHGLTLPCLFSQLWNVNQILFRFPRVTVGLSMAHPQLITSAEEPLSIRPWGFSPHLRFYYRRDSHYCKIHLGLLLGFPSRSTLAYSIYLSLDVRYGWVIGSQLWHVYFRGRFSRRVRG